MIVSEIRRCIKTVPFLIIVICSIYFIYLSIVSVDKYQYAQPLSKTEYTYFQLKDEYFKGSITVFKGSNLSITSKILNEKEKKVIHAILLRMNPKFQKYETIKSVKLQITHTELKKLIQKLELRVGDKTRYGYMLDFYTYPLYAQERFQGNRNNNSGRNTFDQEKMNFNLAYKHGITNAYARYLSDCLGLLIGILPVFFAAFIFSRDRKNRMNDLVFITTAKSVELVGSRILSVLIPFASLYYLITGAISFYFAYLNQLYGYNMNYFDFFKYTTIWVMPTLLLITTSSVFLDILIENEILVFGIQFLIWFLSICNMFDKYTIGKTVIRFNGIGYEDLYENFKHMIWINRSFACLMSFLFFLGACAAYEISRRRGVGYKESLFLWYRESMEELQGKLRKRFINLSDRGQSKNKSRLHYQLRYVFSWNFWVCLVFVVSMFLTSFNNKMNTIGIAMTGENVLIFVSLFIFIPICNIERESDIQNFVYTSNTSYVYLFFQRVILAIILLGLFIEIPLFIMVELSHASLGRWCIGIFLSSLYIAIISMLVSEVCSSRKAGILVYIGYYFLCVFMEKKMPFMTICGYSYFLKFTKYQLLAGIIVGLLLLGVIVYYKQLGRGVLWDEN